MDLTPVLISMKTAGVAVIFTFILGMAAARWVVSIKHKWIKTVIDGLFTLPLVLPPTVAGFFLLYVFGTYRPVGRLFFEIFGIKIAFSWGATVLAAIVVSFPLMYRSARGALEQVDPELAEAAKTMGASNRVIFFKINMPAAAPGILTGVILAYVRGLGEFGATSMIAGNIAGKTRTLPIAVYSEVAAGNMDNAGVYVLILIVISFLMVVALNVFGGRKT